MAPFIGRKSQASTNLFALSDRDELAITMALGSPKDALDAFRRWGRGVVFEDLPTPTHRLLPLAAQKLEHLESLAGDELLGKFTKASRIYWLKSQMTARAAGQVVAMLLEQGIPAMLVKGSAVVWHLGGNVRSRPMDDIDLLVRPDQVREALDVFHRAGFVEDTGALNERDLGLLISQRHAIGLHNAEGIQLDLHWHPISCSRNARTAEHFWEGAQQGSVAGSPCLVASRADCVVHAIAHAYGNRPFMEARWLPDVYLLASDPHVPVDWERVVATAHLTRCAVPVSQALDVAARHTDLSVPNLVFGRLGRGTWVERTVTKPRLAQYGAMRPATQLESLVDAYNEYLSGDVSQSGAIRNLIGFLSTYWSVTPRSVVGHAAFVALGRPQRLRRSRTRSTTYAAHMPCLRPGEQTWFTLGSEGVTALVRGWSNPEAHGTWSTGAESQVRIGIEDAKILAITFTPFLAPGHPRIELEVVIDNQLCQRFVFTGTMWLTQQIRMELPSDPLSGKRDADIRFIVRRPMSPGEACLEAGTRPLGISLARMEVY